MSHESKPGKVTRRRLLGCAAAVPAAGAAPSGTRPPAGSMPEIVRAPDSVTVFTDSKKLRLSRSGGRWSAEDVVVTAEPRREGGRDLVPISVEAPQSRLMRICVRWRGAFPSGWRFLGDVWERGYGDLEWRGLAPERIMPWYFAAAHGDRGCAYGVRTAPAALCFWQVDGAGVSLWLDVRSGAEGVRLGKRRLEVATVAGVRRESGECAVRMTHRLCRALCPNPLLREAPYYGWNNWYYTGPTGSSAREVEHDAELLASLAPAGDNRPYMVVDLGWEVSPQGAGPWDRGNDRFPDMPGLARKIAGMNVIPGIWIRPLLTTEKLPEKWSMPLKRKPRQDPRFMVMDPSLPEVLDHVRRAIRQLTGWGYRMIKFDFSTCDLMAKWGFEMGADITLDGWSFADSTRTTAEIILDFYRAIREAAGKDVPLIGCNVIGHLAAGLVELQRIGDDTGDQDWNRARKMVVNALGFRVGQHNAFFAADADCAVHTKHFPTRLSRQLLDLLARSGTPLFVSMDPTLLDAEWKAAIRTALAIASKPQEIIEPLDWMDTTAPAHWRSGSRILTYDWYGDEGANPLVR